jgi:hypothetical protein
VHERLIENWLTNVNELGYQLAFGQVLLSQDYTILHMSRHGRGEHGKDIIARARTGEVFTFQLKGGDIDLPSWRAIRGEVEELVRLPARRAGHRTITEHIPVLVTNGEVVGDAMDNIEYFAETWERAGAPRLQVWQKGEVFKMFLDAHGSFLPKELPNFRRFVELFVANFSERIDRPRFARMVWDITQEFALEGKKTKSIRTIDSLILLSYYILQQYEEAENWISAAEGWSLVASHVMYVATKDRLPPKLYKPALDLCWLGLRRNLDRFEAEVLSRDNLLESRFSFAEPAVYGPRTTLVLGWLAASTMCKFLDGEEIDSAAVTRVFKREGRRLHFLTEADWPCVVAMSLYFDRFIETRQAENLINIWIHIVTNANTKDTEKGGGFPNSYWLQERAIELLTGDMPGYEKEDFSRHSYTTYSALTMLVRRLCRAAVSSHWPSASKLLRCDFNPSDVNDWFLWSTNHGITRFIDPEQPISWSEWRTKAASPDLTRVPKILHKELRWILPLVLTMPHRLNESMCDFIDAAIGRRAYTS